MSGTDFGKLSKKIRGGESETVKEMKARPPELIVSRLQNRTGLVGLLVPRLFRHLFNDQPILVTINQQQVGHLGEGHSLRCVVKPGLNTIAVGSKSIGVQVFLDNGTSTRFFCYRKDGFVGVEQA